MNKVFQVILSVFCIIGLPYWLLWQKYTGKLNHTDSIGNDILNLCGIVSGVTQAICIVLGAIIWFLIH